MITPAEIRQKALKLFNSGKMLQAELQGETLFPWSVAFRKPNARQQLNDFASIRAWIESLKKQSAENTGSGYQIHYKVFNHRQLGEQRLPETIVFETRDDLLRFIHKLLEFKQLLALATTSISHYPVLHEWICAKPHLFMKHQEDWHPLFSVCQYFVSHPRPNCYIRELGIQGVDSKFIEQHKGILSELLNQLLAPEDIHVITDGSKLNTFERRYGLKYQESLIRLRLLDSTLNPMPELNDLSLPVSQLVQWQIPCEKVFITENKINGLSFPDQDDSVVIFGLGYGVDSLAGINWLHMKELFYWGDIDTHGFSILARLRHYFPKTKALMMDQTTLKLFDDLCVNEPEKSRCTHALKNLSDAESGLYHDLQQSKQRLEQERIPIQYVLKILRQL